MVQTRLLRKTNADSHYTNAVYSFLKSRVVKHSNETVMISADANARCPLESLDSQ